MSTEIFIKDGSTFIASKIEEAIQNGTRTATVSGCYEIETEIRLPSDFTLILENAHLRMADGVFSNMFINEHCCTEIGKTTEGTDRNINVIGRGKAILDGGKYNGLSERTQLKNGLPPVWKNNLLLFTNVDGFKISNLSCHNQRWWALDFIYCTDGFIGNIDFKANDIMIDADGNEHHGLTRTLGRDVLVKNADGIDLRQGCHDIVIENITGFTEDDSIALTALDGGLEKRFAVSGLVPDLCNVTIRNICTASFCTNVRLLSQGDVRLHDILIDGVTDTSDTSPYMDVGLYAVRIGDTRMYGTRHATEDETYNVTIKNVIGKGQYAVALAGAMKNVVMDNIKTCGSTKILLDEREKSGTEN